MHDWAFPAGRRRCPNWCRNRFVVRFVLTKSGSGVTEMRGAVRSVSAEYRHRSSTSSHGSRPADREKSTTQRHGGKASVGPLGYGTNWLRYRATANDRTRRRCCQHHVIMSRASERPCHPRFCSRIISRKPAKSVIRYTLRAGNTALMSSVPI